MKNGKGKLAMTKKESRLIRIIFFLLGVVAGFLLSPVKKGSYVAFGDDNIQGDGLKKKREESDEDTGD